ncbi:MAG: SDR family NAD(P)-dependent oxidoreductase [Eubacteriales bacterium]|nr:SDR family NAD(P)-dependent oxidoreductase [Eubacteriales bacterium]
MTDMKKVVFVTASCRGIGFAVVRRFAEAGHTTYMGYFSEEELAETKQEIERLGLKNIRPVFNDARDKDSYRQAVETIIEEMGRIDVLVNNFGTSNPRTDLDLEHTKYEDFLNCLDLNLSSVFLSSQAVIPHMEKQGGGAIINISSIGGVLPDIARIGYAVSKNAINYMTENMALQLGRKGIRVNAVCPGQTATDAVKKNMSPEFQELFMRHCPIRRMAEPSEMAEAVFYFASDAAAYTTGQILVVAGGFGLGTPIFADFADRSADERH